MKEYKDFTDLMVWQKSHSLVVQIYKLTKNFPSEEKFRLVDQICRSAISMPSNIAEGFGRSSKKEFKRFLLIAKGSTKELFYHLILARDLGYLDNTDFKVLKNNCDEVSKMLSGLVKSIRESIDSQLPTQNSKLR